MDAPVSTSPSTGMPSIDNRLEMGGATARPTGATLALGDPSVSLNASEGFESGHQQEAIPVLDLKEVGAWLALGHVAGANAVTGCGQDNGRQSAPLHRRGSTSPTACPAACLGV